MNPPLTYWIYSWGPTYLYLVVFIVALVWMSRFQSKRWTKFFESAARAEQNATLLIEQNKLMVAKLGEIKTLLEDRKS